MKDRGFDDQRGNRDDKKYHEISAEHTGAGLFPEKEIERDKGTEDGKAGASREDRGQEEYESKEK